MRYAVLALLVTMAGLGSTAWAQDSSINFIRVGPTLKVGWLANRDGTWQLVDESGHVCRHGRSTTGRNTVEFEKVPTADRLHFRVQAEGVGGELQEAAISTRAVISPLPKVDRAAIIYQLPVRTYLARGMGANNVGKLEYLTRRRLQEIRDLGVDYLWLTGILEHASRASTDADVVKGDAGSYFAISDNWDVSEEIGGLEQFSNVVERAHSVGLRILIDLVVNHTARVHKTDVACKERLDFGVGDQTTRFFERSNNYYYVQGEAFTPPMQNGDDVDGVFDTDIFTPGVQPEIPARVTGNDIVSSRPQIDDWFETVKLNYGWDLETRSAHYAPRPRTWDQVVDIAKYWLQLGVDGFRVDYAHSVPIDFWRFFNQEIRAVNPNAFVMAEAYEADRRMALPGFSYQAMLSAGVDTIYNSSLYWAVMKNASQPGHMRGAVPSASPLVRPEIVRQGAMLTNYMENHDEVRLASRRFAPWVGDRTERAHLGLAYTAYVSLLPGNLLLHGGQELQEDASIYGLFAGDSGRTSIFDYVYGEQTRAWVHGAPSPSMRQFRNRYKALLELKRQSPFSLAHSEASATMVDLAPANHYKEQAAWVASYLRFGEDSAYLVVTNSDPFSAHEATIHFTQQNGHDALGALAAMGVGNSDERVRFVEVFARDGWMPSDPAISGAGIPGWALFRSGDIPSGLFLGEIPPATTYVFRVEHI